MARVTGKKFHREPCKVKDGRLIYGEVRLYGLFIRVGRGNVRLISISVRVVCVKDIKGAQAPKRSGTVVRTAFVCYADGGVFIFGEG